MVCGDKGPVPKGFPWKWDINHNRCDVHPDKGEGSCCKARGKYKPRGQKRQLWGEQSYHELAGSASVLKWRRPWHQADRKQGKYACFMLLWHIRFPENDFKEYQRLKHCSVYLFPGQGSYSYRQPEHYRAWPLSGKFCLWHKQHYQVWHRKPVQGIRAWVAIACCHLAGWHPLGASKGPSPGGDSTALHCGSQIGCQWQSTNLPAATARCFPRVCPVQRSGRTSCHPGCVYGAHSCEL